jgi:hypothetical protein
VGAWGLFKDSRHHAYFWLHKVLNLLRVEGDLLLTTTLLLPARRVSALSGVALLGQPVEVQSVYKRDGDDGGAFVAQPNREFASGAPRNCSPRLNLYLVMPNQALELITCSDVDKSMAPLGRSSSSSSVPNWSQV